MAGKKKTAAKPKTPVVPAVVSDIRNIAGNLAKVDVVKELQASRDKAVASVNRYADRVAKVIAGAGKAAERAEAKAVREGVKIKRAEAKKEKVAKRIADLKAKLADAEKALES